jgi:hypothetical protein
MVFCRESGWKELEEAVEARDGVCSMTDMVVAGLLFVRGLREQNAVAVGRVSASDLCRSLSLVYV